MFLTQKVSVPLKINGKSYLIQKFFRQRVTDLHIKGTKMHKPSPNEKLFFFLSGVIVSVPFTLFFSQLSNYICVVLPVFYANLCSIAVITPFVEEFAKAYPLFYRHGESERSIFHLVCFRFGSPPSYQTPLTFFSRSQYFNNFLWYCQKKIITILLHRSFPSFF